MTGTNADWQYTLRQALNNFSAVFRCVSAKHTDELRNEIEELLDRQIIDRELYARYLSWFRFNIPDFTGRSILIIAVPQPLSQVSFQIGNKTKTVVIPPTYIYSKDIEKCRKVLAEIFGSEHILMARLPLKLLAARSGLGQYGRNNLIYVPGMGSHAKLISFYLDKDLETDHWQEAEMLADCADCDRCIEKCPTGCIPGDGFIINASKCLTYYNENAGDLSGLVQPNAHNSLVGCMRCQVICPANRPFLKNKKLEAEFTGEETDHILNDRIDHSSALSHKLKSLDMDDYINVIPRNLRALI